MCKWPVISVVASRRIVDATLELLASAAMLDVTDVAPDKPGEIAENQAILFHVVLKELTAALVQESLPGIRNFDRPHHLSTRKQTEVACMDADGQGSSTHLAILGVLQRLPLRPVRYFGCAIGLLLQGDIELVGGLPGRNAMTILQDQVSCQLSYNWWLWNKTQYSISHETSDANCVHGEFKDKTRQHPQNCHESSNSFKICSGAATNLYT